MQFKGILNIHLPNKNVSNQNDCEITANLYLPSAIFSQYSPFV